MSPSDERTADLSHAPAADNTASLGGTGPAAAPDPGTPDRLGKYRVLGVLGRGGMGVVYRAEDTVLRRVVALKVLPATAAADPVARERFLREARAQAAVEHDHVVPIYEVVDDAAVPFLAMPVLRGMTLADALRANARPPLWEVVRIAREAAAGLAAAHATGLVHRDVKPGNIWLEDGRLRVKLLDFGLARAAGTADAVSSESFVGNVHLTQTGAILGTPAYMSPEQALGRPLDHRTDLFSLGVVLYQMLAGRLPFPGDTVADVMRAVVRGEPVPVGQVVPELPPPLAALVGRLLAKKPAARPSSAADVAAELGAFEQGLTTVIAPAAGPWGDLTDDTPTLTEQRPAVRRRGSPWVPLTFALLGLGVIAAAVAALLWGRSATETAFLDIDDAGAEAVELTLKRDGVPVAERTRERKFALPPGVYTVEVSAPDPAVKLSSGLVTLDRGGREKLTLRVSERVVVTRKLDDYNPDDPEWLKLFLKQPPKVQVAHFTKELKRLNPDFDGKLVTTDSDGQVISLKLRTDAVADLSPVRALRHLTKLEVTGSAPGRGRFADLTPLRGLPLGYLDLEHNPLPRGHDALRGMPLRELHWLGVAAPEQLRPLSGGSISLLRLIGPGPVDAADVKAAVVDGATAYLDVGQVVNLDGLRGRHLRTVSVPRSALADPALAELNVDHLTTNAGDEALAAHAATLRRNTHIRVLNFQSTPVFWAWYGLAPRPAVSAWQVAGPFPSTAHDPFDPTATAGRAPVGPFPHPDGGTRPWQPATVDGYGMVNYGDLTGRPENAVTWVTTTLRADQAGRAVLFISGNQSYRVWLNGTPIYFKPYSSPWGMERTAFLVELVGGDNYLTVRGGLSERWPLSRVGLHLHRLRPGEAPPAGIEPPATPPKP